MKGCDMIASLHDLPEIELEAGLRLKRAFCGDKPEILAFVGEHFSPKWIYEAEMALFHRNCFLVTEGGRILGFACYDASAKGFFGPIGVHPDHRGRGIGKALLLRTLEAMKEDGYAYAIIGWVDGAEHFYRKTVDAEFIKNGTPDRSIYANLVSM